MFTATKTTKDPRRRQRKKKNRTLSRTLPLDRVCVWLQTPIGREKEERTCLIQQAILLFCLSSTFVHNREIGRSISHT